MSPAAETSIEKVDVVILGAGTAGLNARRAVLKEGKSLLMFDPGPLGTTCARIGCMPSKLLIAAAEHKHSADHAGDFGIQTTATVDSVSVMKRVRKFRDLFVSKTNKGIASVGNPIPEAATFVGPNLLEAGGKRYEFGAAIIATGSENFVPGVWEPARSVMLSNDDVFELERLPESLLVVGAGVIGLELGQAMSRLGVRVHILDVSGKLGGLQDPAMVQLMRDNLGVPTDLQYTLHEVSVVEGGVRVRFTGQDGKEHDNVWQNVLMAAGRKPRLRGLGLAAAGLDPLPAIDPETGRLGDTAIYVSGDATGSLMILHEAAHEGATAGTNAALHPERRPQTRKVPFGVVFTDPQIAQVGQKADVVGSLDFKFQSRAKVLGRDRGKLEVYAKKDGTLTGATIIGPDAEHLAHLLAWSIQAGFDVDKALAMPFYHPVIEEGLQAALRKLQASL